VKTSAPLNPTSVVGRQTSTGTATLTGQAPAGGAIVSLATSNPSAATVPGSTTVPQGASTANFVVTAGPVQTPATAVISGTLSATRSATLTVTPCTVTTAPAPVLPVGDTIWVEDAVPPGSVSTGIWNWSTTQKVSGTASHTEPVAAGIVQHYFSNSNTNPLVVAAAESIVSYVLINPCEAPREIMLQFQNKATGSWEHRAYWGENVIPWGTAGTISRVFMGPLPQAGAWVRLEVPSVAVGLGGKTVNGMSFAVSEGQAWWDRGGKTTCTVPVPTPPSAPATDTVWVEDSIPSGGVSTGTWVWDTTQKVSGTSSNLKWGRTRNMKYPNRSRLNQYFIFRV